MTINVSPTTGKDTTHHLKLTDSSATKLGLICCDARGEPLARVGVNPYPPFASQLRQGRGEHADRRPPFEDIPLSDFSGGMAMLHHDEDASKYLDGMMADTSREGYAVISGLPKYTSGIRDFDENWLGDVSWLSLDFAGANRTTTFVAGASYDVNSIVVILKKVGAPTGNISVLLLASGGSVLKSKVLTVGTDLLTDLVSERVEFVFSSVQTIAAQTTYKVKVAYSGSSSDYVDVAIESGGALYYRVLDDTADFDALTFELNGGFYLITQPEDRSASKLYLLGERGVADSNSGALTTLVDASKTGGTAWTTDEWIGGVAKIVGGPGSDEDEPYRTIISNTTNTLTMLAWNVTHTTDTEYVIMLDKWQLMQTFTYYVTDVAVGDNYAVMALGTAAGIRRYQVKELNGAMSETLSASGNLKAERLAGLSGGVQRNQRGGGTLYLGQYITDYPTIRSRVLPPYSDADIHGLVKYLPLTHEPWDHTSYTNVNNYISDGFITIEVTSGVSGDIAKREFDFPFICTSGRYFEFGFMADANYDAGDLQFGYEDKSGDRLNVNLPALVADTWKYVSILMPEKPSATEGTLNEDKITTYYIKTTKSNAV